MNDLNKILDEIEEELEVIMDHLRDLDHLSMLDRCIRIKELLEKID